MSLERFEINVGSVNPYGNFVTVSILWHDSECPAPDPFWHDKDNIFVTTPNIIERLLGITFATKLNRAKLKLKKRATEHLQINLKFEQSLTPPHQNHSDKPTQ